MTTANITLGTAWTQVADSSREFLLTLPGRTRIDVDIATTDDLVAPTVARGHILAADRHGRITRAMVGPGNVWAKTAGPTTAVLDSWNADLATIMQMEGLAGYWPADPAYIYEDSAGTIPASVGGVVGHVDNLIGTTEFGSDLVDTLNTVGVWSVIGTNTVVADAGALKFTYVDSAFGAYAALNAAAGLSTDLVIGKTYLIQFAAKVSTGTVTLTPTNNAGTAIGGAVDVAATAYANLSTTFTASATTSNQIRLTGFGAGEILWISGITIKEVIGSAAIQSTTANKPYLRRTPTSNVYWLDSNTATSALTATLGNLGAACTVARAGAEGVTFTEGVTISSTYNIAPAFGFNSDIAIFNRALTVTEKALLTRYMSRGVPVLGSNLVTNGTFNTDLAGWTPDAVWTWSAGKAASSGAGYLTSANAAVLNKSYYLVYDYLSTTGRTRWSLPVTTTLTVSGQSGTSKSTIIAASPIIRLQSPDAGSSLSVDNLIVQEIL